MPTSTITEFIGPAGDVEVAVYRHWGDSSGADVLEFLELDKAEETGSQVGNAAYLAARFVAYLASLYPGRLGLGVAIVDPEAERRYDYTFRITHDGVALVDDGDGGWMRVEDMP